MPVTNNDTKVITGKVRLSYANVWKPVSIDGNDPKYSVSLLIPKTDKETLSKIKQAIEAAKQAGTNLFGGKVPPNLKTPLRDGDEERPDDPVYKGHYFINASAKNKPGIVDMQRNPIENSDEVYSGCYARASINFYAFSAKGNKGIAAGLNNLQKVAEGDFLGGRSRAEDDFADDFEEEF